jgi:hypothetical protein
MLGALEQALLGGCRPLLEHRNKVCVMPVALQAVAGQSGRHLSLLVATAPKLLVMGEALTMHRTQRWSAPAVRRKMRPRS